jgi:uncharacterized protein (TIGR02452 family)
MALFEPRIPRDLATRLGEEAVAISTAGQYVGPAGLVQIGPAVARAIQATAHYTADHVHPAPATGPHQTAYEVTNETTLSAHRRHQAKGHNVVSLNFAAAVQPGGGFLTGARAQEEYLCRSSALYLTIKDSPMYAYHRREGHNRYSDAMIYSPEVPVFRDDEHRLLPEPYHASFITSAAPLAKYLHPEETAQLPELLRTRIVKILTVAQVHGHDSLVLGAWGCGAFGNDGGQVAALFKWVLAEDFKGAFKEVTFAIVDTSDEKKFIAPFAACFHRPTEIDLNPLWEIVSQAVEGRVNDEWRLVRSTNPQVTHFLQMGMHGTNMKCLFIPRTAEKPGIGQVILNLGPGDMQRLLRYTKEHPEALLSKPLTFPIHLESNDADPTRWEKGGVLFAHGNLVTPAGPELFARFGPWYVDALEGIWNFIAQASAWHHQQDN